MSPLPRVLPVGDAAVTVELGDAIDPAVNARVRALDRALAARPFEGLLETVPSYRALLVLFDSRVVSAAKVRDVLGERLAQAPSEDARGRLHVVPVRYGGEHGPDLAAVARARNLGEADVVALHAGREYTAFMLGFSPGFAYLGLLPGSLDTPRLATPRVRVPAGSVAIAGRQTAIYPSATAGGWNLIGRTTVRLFDPRREPPALIQPGDRVRFEAVSELPGPEAAPGQAAAVGDAAVEVLDGGLLTTVQDGGRRGYRRQGVGSGGPMDAPAHAAANALVGNPPDAAALECTLAGPALRFLRPAPFALAGADLDAVLERSDLGEWPVPVGQRVLARSGNVLRFRGRRAGCRAYLALAGGIDVPLVLGSRATDLVAGFGGFEGRALRTGDALALGPARGDTPRLEAWRGPAAAAVVTLRVVLGPQAEPFDEASIARCLSQEWTVAATSDRVGFRLKGEPLRHRGPAEIVTDGMLPGCVQVPPDGQPIVMMADSPTTGGYPKIATVLGADLPLLAQLVPGEGRVRFEATNEPGAEDLSR